MGKLDEPTFSAILAAGCTACGHATLEVSSFVDRSVAIMLGTPNDAGRWAYDGEKFVDGTYAIRCAKCKHVAWSDPMCPRCNAPDGLAKALADATRLRLPKRCPSCNETELLALALVNAVAIASPGVPGGAATPQALRSTNDAKATALAELDEPGYHVVAFACDACDHAVVAQTCPLCDAPGPLRARP